LAALETQRERKEEDGIVNPFEEIRLRLTIIVDRASARMGELITEAIIDNLRGLCWLSPAVLKTITDGVDAYAMCKIKGFKCREWAFNKLNIKDLYTSFFLGSRDGPFMSDVAFSAAAPYDKEAEFLCGLPNACPRLFAALPCANQVRMDRIK
jgi:hypothetical protein